jgi:RNA polymerase primary sigma factor
MPRSDIIRKVIAFGRQRGFVTFDGLNELLPSTTMAPEDIEAVMAALGDEGINVIEDEEPKPD